MRREGIDPSGALRLTIGLERASRSNNKNGNQSDRNPRNKPDVDELKSSQVRVGSSRFLSLLDPVIQLLRVFNDFHHVMAGPETECFQRLFGGHGARAAKTRPDYLQRHRPLPFYCYCRSVGIITRYQSSDHEVDGSKRGCTLLRAFPGALTVFSPGSIIVSFEIGIVPADYSITYCVP